jgi:GMP synthase (glutamine-hydrolysing)
VAVSSGRGTFWGLQYHPEYDLHEMARLTFCRIDKLVRAGLFRDRQAALDYVDKLETLHEDPQRKDLAWLLGVDEDVMSDEVRLCEVRNWIARSVLPRVDR